MNLHEGFFDPNDLEKTGDVAPKCPKCDHGFMACANDQIGEEWIHIGYKCPGCGHFIHIENAKTK